MYIHNYVYRRYAFDVFPDNAAILSGKKIACFYTISKAQAARNL